MRVSLSYRRCFQPPSFAVSGNILGAVFDDRHLGSVTRRRARAGGCFALAVLIAGLLTLWSTKSSAQPPPPPPPSSVTIIEDVANTKHNLSSTGPPPPDRRVFTTATSEICVFCHTPHGAAAETLSLGAPLWNRRLSTASYDLYDNAWSFSFEGELNVGAPTGFSRLCLSCHDGTIALGSVMNAPGSGGYRTDIPMIGSPQLGPGGEMPFGGGAGGAGEELTGDTRYLGKYLRNDHAISFVFDSTLVASRDPELVDPGPVPLRPSQETPYKTGPPGPSGQPTGIGPLRRYAGEDPVTPKYDSIQCTSCHNPHAVTFPRFLRAPIVDCSKVSDPCPGSGQSANSEGQQLICYFCHDKDQPAGNFYSTSTHALSEAKHVQYPTEAEYPANPGYNFDGDPSAPALGHSVGQVSCRNCHDPHTAQGAMRLHREGVDTPGGADAVENTCYLCHSPGPSSGAGIEIQPAPLGRPTLPAGANSGFLANVGTRIAPDIYTQFAKDHNLTGPAVCPNQVNCGSAMNLQLDDTVLTATGARNHQPFFVKRPQEGVQYASASPPGTENEFEPGIFTPDTIDTRHIECVDCHNPHQVTNPNLGGADLAGRIKGMKGITHNTEVVGVGIAGGTCDPFPCYREPYIYEVCFRCHGNSVPTLFQANDFPGSTILRSNPQPGGEAAGDGTSPAIYVNLSYRGFSNKRLEFSPSDTLADLTAGNMTSTTVDPDKGQYEDGPPTGLLNDPTNGQPRLIGPGLHKSYHPVVGPGRNGTIQLCNQLMAAFVGLTCTDATSASTSLKGLTIQCTDCHNNDFYDAYQDGTLFNPIAGLLGPITESNLRPTDRTPNPLLTVNYNGVGGTPPDPNNPPRVSEPIGPHGSNHVRILRAPYNTDISNASRQFRFNGFNSPAGPDAPQGNHFNNFLLCFQCHDRAAFDPSYTFGGLPSSTNPAITGFYGNPTVVTGAVTGGGSPGPNLWQINLHQYHLVRTGAYCHECHNNVHSNAQARNTIFGAGSGAVVGVNVGPGLGGTCAAPAPGCVGLPPDVEDGIIDGVSDTHLINFAPPGPTGYLGELPPPGGFDHYAVAGVEGVTAPLPVWYFDGSATAGVGDVGRFRCNLRCHGVVMATCHYRALDNNLNPVNLLVGNEAGGDPTAWCSGGITQESCSQSDGGIGGQPGC